MSSPPNPLDAYRSYAYHHILIAADSTATAIGLAEAPELELAAYEHPDIKFCPKDSPNGGKYVVLINGMTDAQFSIKSAKWASVIVPSAGTTSSSQAMSSTTMAVDGELVVVEPQGLNFMNLLNETTKMLKIDPTTITFVLKTIFIGHRDDGTQRYIMDIKPLVFMMIDITAAIDVAGAEYTMGLVGVANGAGKMPHMTSLATGFEFNIPTGDIQNAMSVLTRKLNEKYKTERHELKDAMARCGTGIDIDQEFSHVEYSVTAPDYSGYPVGDLEDGKYRTGDSGTHVAQLGRSSSIENLIGAVMNSSSKVARDAQEDPPNRFIYKIVSDIDTSSDVVKVNYYVHRYQATVIPVEEFLTFEPPEGQGIEYDYIFTGNNIDIIDFDLRMQMGLVFYQVMAAQCTSPTTSSQLLKFYNQDTFVGGVGSKDGAGDQQDASELCNQRAGEPKKKPLFLGTSLQNPLFRDTKAIGSSAGFNTMLQRHAALENLEAKMKIRGNPQLLADSTQLPSEIRTDNPTETQTIDPGEGIPGLRTIMPSLHTTPGYVKVRVHAPKSWTGSAAKSAEEQASSFDNDFSENIWYDGWYFLLQIDNVFDNGEFTQDLNMISLPVDSGESKLGKCDGSATSNEASSTTTSASSASSSASSATSTSSTAPAAQPAAPVVPDAEKATVKQVEAARAARANTGRNR